MSRFLYSWLLIGLLSLNGCVPPAPAGIEAAPQPYTIGLGSCAHQDKPQTILRAVLARRPDVFIYLGDNIYGDSEDTAVLRQKYAQLAAKPTFRALRAQVPLLATWDDHDYGANDAGRYYAQKEASKQLFLEFWEEPAGSTRREHAGIYHSVFLDDAPLRVQVLLLDTRTFRHDLLHYDSATHQQTDYKNDYVPNPSPDSTFLGAAQWAWLEQQLKLPAELRIIASSNQFAHQYNGWESWTNVPQEQTRLLQLIQQTGAQGVVFISGDVHWGELSKWDNGITDYPIYDLTSSGLTQNWSDTEPNAHRVGKVVRENNFGLIAIKTSPQDTTVTFRLVNKQNKVVLEHPIKLSDLR